MAVLHWLLPLLDPGAAIGQCGSGGITVATEVPAHCADNVILDEEDSGRPPLPHWGYPMWASIFLCQLYVESLKKDEKGLTPTIKIRLIVHYI